MTHRHDDTPLDGRVRLLRVLTEQCVSPSPLQGVL